MTRLVGFLLFFMLWGSMPMLALCSEARGAYGHFMDYVQQRDSTARARRPVSQEARIKWLVQDSARFARELEKQRLRDSLALARDSLVFQYLRPLSPNSPNLFLDSLLEVYTVKDGDLLAYAKKFHGDKERFYQRGTPRQKKANWELYSLGILLLLFGVISFFFRGELLSITYAFYSDRMVMQLSKEDNLFTSWAFVFLYTLFGFTLGMFIYLASSVVPLQTDYTGIQLFFVFSMAVILLFTAKIILIRLLGFVFDAQRLVRDYVSALYICYFNIAIALLPILFAMVFLSLAGIEASLYIALATVVLILCFQFFRVSKNILSNYQFSKFYLFLYLCTLEISPILVLLKVVGL